jgi:glucose 1-dehydrogenase
MGFGNGIDLTFSFSRSKACFSFVSINSGGAIVNVSSIHSIMTSSGIAAYAASKGGLLAMTRALAIEFAKNNIRVNTIIPGAVDTKMLREGLNRGHVGIGNIDQRLKNLANKTVNGKIGKIEEIAHAIFF